MNKEEEEEDAVKEEDDVRSECKSARIVMASCNYTLAQLRIFPVFTCLCLRSIATRPYTPPLSWTGGQERNSEKNAHILFWLTTDGRTDGRTDTPSYRDARTHLEPILMTS